MLGRRGITLITGGRRGGVMEAASRGAARAGGLTVGITPGDDARAANPWCDIVLPTGLGHARNAITALAGDFVVAVGGGAGTLSELCFAWIHARPIYVLAGSEGWSDPPRRRRAGPPRLVGHRRLRRSPGAGTRGGALLRREGAPDPGAGHGVTCRGGVIEAGRQRWISTARPAWTPTVAQPH